MSALMIQTLAHDVQKHWPGAPNAGAGGTSWLLSIPIPHVHPVFTQDWDSKWLQNRSQQQERKLTAEDEGCMADGHVCQIKMTGWSCGTS